MKGLIASEKNAPDFLSAPAFMPPDTHPKNDSLSDLQGKKFGAYLLCEKIGQGGMGAVYRAERIKRDFKQQVAIKILGQKNDSQKYSLARERFEREQQLLASLNHTNIAQLYDGGIGEDGFAYFVMEYVAGIPIDRYCSENKLSLESILKLIETIAQTLAFAHAHLIIHRDIKASNILVSEHGEIKLLDFGIAKLIDTAQQHSLTCTGEQVLTPGAAAPEQLLNHPISVATDIYQLGLLSHELVTGLRVHHDRADSLAILVQLICKDEVPSPSRTLRDQNLKSANKSTMPNSYRNRKNWAATIKGDIDAIILTMLKTDPRQRYGSMEALCRDIHAYFQKRPLKAREISILYHSGKYFQRHWRGLSAAGLVIALSFFHFSQLQSESAKTQAALAVSVQEQKKAEALSSFLINTFKAADPRKLGARNITARDLLDQGETRAKQDLDESPKVQATMLLQLGEINQSLGDYKNALSLFESAAKIESDFLEHNPPSSPSQRKISPRQVTRLNTEIDPLYFGRIARAHEALGNAGDARDYYQRAIAGYKKLGNLQDMQQEHLLSFLNELGVVEFTLGQINTARNNWQQVLRYFRERDIHYHRQLAICLNNLALLNHREANLDAASAQMVEAIDINEKLLGRQHPTIAMSLRNLAIKMTDWEQLPRAETLMLRALELQKNSLDPLHPDLVNTQSYLGFLYHRQGRYKQANALFEDVLAMQARNSNTDSVDRAATLYRLAELQRDMEKYEQADQSFTKMHEIYLQTEVGKSVLGRGLAGKASLALAKGDLNRAHTLYDKALSLLPKQSMRYSLTHLDLALVLLQQNRASETLEIAYQVLDYREARLPVDHNLNHEARILIALASLTLAHTDKNSCNQCEPKNMALLNTSYQALNQTRHPRDRYLSFARKALRLGNYSALGAS